MNLSEPFIRRPVMTVVLTVSAILFGVLAYHAAAGERSAGGRLSGHPGERRLSRREPGDDGEQRRHAAGAAVHADPRAGAGHQQEQRRDIAALTLQFALNKSIDAAATDVQTAITRDGQLAAGSAQPADVHARPIRTISRSCTSRCTSDTMTARRSSTTWPARRSASASASSPACSQVQVLRHEVGDAHQGRSVGARGARA